MNDLVKMQGINSVTTVDVFLTVHHELTIYRVFHDFRA